eukprot:IDg4682t1
MRAFSKKIFNTSILRSNPGVCVLLEIIRTRTFVSLPFWQPFVGCNSHKLNLEVNLMVDSQSDMRYVIESVHGTMASDKQLKDAAILRNLTDYKPFMHNKTRWSGKLHILHRFLLIRDELIEASQSQTLLCVSIPAFVSEQG